jgi:hypothetical protein
VAPRCVNSLLPLIEGEVAAPQPGECHEIDLFVVHELVDILPDFLRDRIVVLVGLQSLPELIADRVAAIIFLDDLDTEEPSG